MSAALRYTYRFGARSFAVLITLALIAGVVTISQRPAAAFTSTITATGRFAYVTPSGAIVGIRNAHVEMCDDDGVFGCPTMGTGTTDADGNYTITGTGSDPDLPFQAPDPPDPIMKVIATGPSGRVQSTLLADYCFRSLTRNNVLPGGILNFGTLTPNEGFTCDLVNPNSTSTHNGAWQLYNNVRQAWETMRTETLRNSGRDIQQVRVIWPDNIGNRSFYRPPLPTVDEGSISIKPGDEFKDRVILHEYGHHVLYHFGESPLPDYNNGVCDGSNIFELGHCMWRAEKGSIAWTEGWPTFFGEFMLSTLGKPMTFGCDPIVPTFCGTIESSPQPPPDPDLAHAEGTVSAIMWDLFDANQDNHDGNNSTDRLNLPFSTLWDVYQGFDPDPLSAHDNILNLDELWDAFAALRPTELNRVSEIYDENGLSKPAADLTVTAASSSVPPFGSNIAPGQSLTVTDTTANSGAVRTGTGSVTRFELVPLRSFGALTPLGTRNIGDLLPGGSSTDTTTVTIPAGTSFGSYVIRACADSDGVTFETNESNNCRDTGRFSVGPPVNDAFAAATPISGSSGTATGTNVGATSEPSEPIHVGKPGGASVWWSWTAPSSGQATIQTAGSSFDTLLGVYTGSTVGQLTSVAGNDDCCNGFTSEVTFAATAGTTYRIAVDGFNAQQGNISLGWSLVPPPSVSIGDATVTEGNTGTVAMQFPVSLSAPSRSDVTVNYATVAGTATAPADYTATNATVTFTPNQTTKTVTVLVKGDLLDEANETFKVVLSTPVGAVLGDGTAVGHITDNDPTPSLRINNVQTAEGQSGTKILNFTTSLSAVSGRTVRVDWSTSNLTALAGSDYIAANGTLVIPAGAPSRTIPVTIKGDTVREANETFRVTLSTPVAATIATGTGTGTIVNDD